MELRRGGVDMRRGFYRFDQSTVEKAHPPAYIVIHRRRPRDMTLNPLKYPRVRLQKNLLYCVISHTAVNSFPFVPFGAHNSRTSILARIVFIIFHSSSWYRSSLNLHVVSFIVQIDPLYNNEFCIMTNGTSSRHPRYSPRTLGALKLALFKK